MRTAFAALSFALLLACGNPPSATTPAPPASFSATVLAIDKTIADANSSAVSVTIDLRTKGKISVADAATVESWCAQVATLNKSITAEAASTDTTTAQKQKIGLLLAAFALPKVTGALDPSLQSLLGSILAAVTQIKAQVSA